MNYSKRQLKIWKNIVEEYEDLTVKIMSEKPTAKDLARAIVLKQMFKTIPKKALKIIDEE